MAKKQYQMSRLEMLDIFLPIFGGSWALAFTYISYFARSSVLALITVMPIFFLYSLYLLGSAVYVYKETEILEAMGKDSTDVKARNRKKPPQLNKTKLIFAAIFFVCGVLLCILL